MVEGLLELLAQFLLLSVLLDQPLAICSGKSRSLKFGS